MVCPTGAVPPPPTMQARGIPRPPRCQLAGLSSTKSPGRRAGHQLVNVEARTLELSSIGGRQRDRHQCGFSIPPSVGKTCEPVAQRRVLTPESNTIAEPRAVTARGEEANGIRQSRVLRRDGVPSSSHGALRHPNRSAIRGTEPAPVSRRYLTDVQHLDARQPAPAPPSLCSGSECVCRFCATGPGSRRQGSLRAGRLRRPFLARLRRPLTPADPGGWWRSRTAAAAAVAESPRRLP